MSIDQIQGGPPFLLSSIDFLKTNVANRLLKDLDQDNDSAQVNTDLQTSSYAYNIDKAGTISHQEFLSYVDKLGTDNASDYSVQLPQEITDQLNSIQKNISRQSIKQDMSAQAFYHDLKSDAENMSQLIETLSNDKVLSTTA